MNFAWKERGCERARGSAVRLLDGELDERRRRGLEAHLRDCSRCACEVDSLRSLRKLWREIPGMPSRQEDRQRIRRLATSTPALARAPRAGWTDLVTIAAGGLCIFFAIVIVREPPARRPTRQGSIAVMSSAEWTARDRGAGLDRESRWIWGIRESEVPTGERREER